MEELTCALCGHTTTYADAFTADIHQTCDESNLGIHSWSTDDWIKANNSR